MDLERYKVPASVLQGVEIDLPGSADATFLVALPSEHNRAFISAQQSALLADARLGENGEPDFSAVDFQRFREARIDAFLQCCILKLPDGLTREQLAGEYWPALKALYERAADMAADEEKAAEAAIKKSRA